MTPEPELVRILATGDRSEMPHLIDDVLGDRYACEFASNIDETRAKLATGTFHLAICDTEVVGESGSSWPRRSSVSTRAQPWSW